MLEHGDGAVLRSINLGLDIRTPARFSHFRPTPKSAQVIRAIALGIPSQATMIVAAYGSGKSIAAGFACLAMSGGVEARPQVRSGLSRLSLLDPGLAESLAGLRGLAITVEGALGDLGGELVAAASAVLGFPIAVPCRQGINVILDAIAIAARDSGFDRVAIVWDEFGRHLEVLASEGRAHELAHVQQAAEWTTRQREPSATLTLLMHQGIYHYTRGLSQSARSAWRKVEGRFNTIRFVDSSREMYRLIASVVQGARPRAPSISSGQFRLAAQRALSAGLFRDFDDEADLAEILSAVWPVDPAALHVLPGLAARVAQHERSVFAFVGGMDLARRVTIKDVYDHFAPAMEADVGIGGTHRIWLETESALSKQSAEAEALAIAATALLGLGASGQRVKVSKRMLLTAISPFGDHTQGSPAVQSLINRKLLLYRQRTDDISVWHGTDLDLRAKLEYERGRLETDFDLVSFLSVYRPAPSARPVRHNIERWIRRSWTGAYVAAAELCAAGVGHPMLKIEPGEDGRVLYVVAEGAKDVEAALATIPKILPKDGGVIACLCEEALPLLELALEVACLERLSNDDTLLGSDPLLETEIAHMMDATVEALDQLLDRVATPGKGRQAWFMRGMRVDVRDGVSLAECLSDIAESRFSKTPEFRNELVVRRKLSRPMVNARKRLLLNILEREGEPNLGCDLASTTPDVAMYRTILGRPRLYREKNGKWGWAEGVDIEQRGLREVWLELQNFFEKSGRKPMTDLVAVLRSPPFGVREGLVPILVGAGMKAFGRAVALRKEGKWVKDILASEIEEMCSHPHAFEVEIYDLSSGLGDYLRSVAAEFGRPSAASGDLLRGAADALESWRAQLPDNAFTSPHQDQIVREFQLALAPGHDPSEVLLKGLPTVAKVRGPGPETLMAIRKCRKALESIVEGYQADAVHIIRETLVVSKGDPGNALQRANSWASCFLGRGLANGVVDATAKAVLSRSSSATDGRYTEVSFARALSVLLLGVDFDGWTDRTAADFSRRLRSVAEQLEDAALAVRVPDCAVRPIIEARVGDLLAKLVRVAGREAARDLLRRVCAEEEKWS